MPAKTKTTKPTASQYPTEGFARASDAAKFLAISVRTVYRMIDDKQIKSVRLRDGESPRIPWAALHELVDAAK